MKISLSVGVLALISLYMIIEIHQEGVVLTDEVRKAAPGAFIELEDGRVHYIYEGADSLDLVVFIHGGGVIGMEVLEENIKYFLEHGYRILAFDLYGRGYSDRPNKDHTPLLFEKQLSQLIDSLSITESFDLVAMSMGAIMALDYYQEYPGRVRNMVLIDPAISGNYKMPQILKFPVISDILMTVYWYPMSIQNQKKEFFNKDYFYTYAERVSYFMKFEGYKHANFSTWKHLLNQNKMSLLDEVDPKHLLVIHGSQDPFFNTGQINLFRTEAPQIRMVMVDSTGHLPHYEKSEEVNVIIHSFFEEI